MKILAIVGTNRRKGNITEMSTNLLKGASEKGHETELINLYDYRIEHCRGCWACAQKGECVIPDDFKTVFQKVKEADVIVLGSPVYWGGVSSIMKTFFDRHTGYALKQPKDIDKAYQLKTGEKIRKALDALRNFGPKNDFGRKKFLIISSLTLPFPSAYLSGDLPNTLKGMQTYVNKLQGNKIGTLIFTDTLLRFLPRKRERIMKKAYKMGLKI